MKAETKQLKCSRCGQILDQGKPSWRVELRVWADVPGVPDECRKHPDEIDDMIAQSLKRIAHLDNKSVKNEIFRVLNFRICRDCRDILLANPLNKSL